MGQCDRITWKNYKGQTKIFFFKNVVLSSNTLTQNFLVKMD